PANEPWRRGAVIHPGPGAEVFAEVHQDVHEGVTYRPRSGERASMVAFGPDAPSAAEGAVHRPRDADRNPAKARGQSGRIVRLHQQVHVVALHREFDDAKDATRAGRNRPMDCREYRPRPQAADGGNGTKGRVNGMRSGVRASRTMRNTS